MMITRAEYQHLKIFYLHSFWTYLFPAAAKVRSVLDSQKTEYIKILAKLSGTNKVILNVLNCIMDGKEVAFTIIQNN